MNLIEYADREMMMMALANKIAGELGTALRSHGRASLSVPGGTTPGPVFDMLSAVDLDWANVSVFLNDERWVDETSPRSNTRLLRQRLLQNKAAVAQLVPLYAPAETPEDAMAALSKGIAPHLPISVLLLGMGADMHTASLFPGADRLEEALADDAPLLLPMRADGAGEPRITLTAPVLRGALNTHILITGADKRAALTRAASLPAREAPVRVVLDDATIHWAE
ncbi:6-phosphogluconolactonase [Pseudorhodobacter sp. E13]|uniref:6-phosphogluconolactonase n=1 Tax=Pseudorhodobacter sp. E13 TaxID=2487931 RepID=UPI000F8C3BB6|nr:6-phosphogluconolactonase [Pseudorhodobacter sp. E13]RUS59086.1 6-phosphogluconolactonase [Pseudorhodobacter sp. E13]